MQLGWAVGQVLTKDSSGPVLIGKDTRISGYMFESALEAGLSAAGADIRLLGPMPTPGVAYLTRNVRGGGGIVISASHNPFYDNGVKFFDAQGIKLSDSVEMQIEALLDQPMQVVESAKIGRAKRIVGADRRYIEFCKFRVKNNLDLQGIKIIVDCAHGATYLIAPSVFEELGAEIVTIANEPNGSNINVEYGATSPQQLQKKVIDYNADVGVALDGDGDRLIMVDHQGELVDGDEMLFIISQGWQKSLGNAVVGTVMSNLGLEIAIKELNMDFLRTAVGDRHIMHMLYKHNLKLGGEPSGHIVNLAMTTTGDGIIAALQVLDIMVSSGKSLSELKSGMVKYPQTTIDVEVGKNPLLSALQSRISESIKIAESELGSEGRVLLRLSGTESVLRVMVEGEFEGQVNQIANSLAEELRTCVKAT